MFRQQDDLADVVGVVGELAVNGLHDGVGFAADGDGAGEIGVGERLKSGEQAGPACFPGGEERGAGGGRHFEFAVAITGGFFAVGGQKIGPAGDHVAGDVFDDDGDGIGFGIEGKEELIVGELGDGALGEFLVIGEESQRVFQVGSGELQRHGESVAGSESPAAVTRLPSAMAGMLRYKALPR